MALSSDRNIVTEATILAGLNLVLSYENAAVDRLQKRLSESIVPEVKDKLTRHLLQTREQQEHHRDQSVR
jgi:hypothetical protein